MKKILSCILCGLLFCLLLVCACGPVSDFDRTVEEDQFSVDCTVLNTTLSEQYALEEGDLVVVSHSENGGKFAFQIGISGESPIYIGDSSAPERFTVRILQSGTYTLSVTGEQAKGMVTFRIMRSK